MFRKWQLLLLALFGGLILFLSPPLISHARVVTETSGFDEASAVIKDSQGKIYAHDAVLPAENSYTVSYKWRISNSAKLAAGDTILVYVPTNVQITKAISFPMKSTTGLSTIGDFTIAAGSHVGVFTLNNKLVTDNLFRNGYINLNVHGAGTTDEQTPPETPEPITMNKSAVWVDPDTHDAIRWNIYVNNNDQTLLNPVITDTLIGHHVYIPETAQATVNKQVTPVTVTTNGNQIVFKLSGKFTSPLKLTYQTKPTSELVDEVYQNDATYHDDNDNEAAADAEIVLEQEETPPVTHPGGSENPEDPGTTEPENPGTTEPGNPGTTEPENPGTTEPGKPGTTEPEKPGTTEPEKPGTTEPENPGTTEPGKPGTTEPENPGTTEPGKPGTTEPEKPGTTEHDIPSTNEPSNPETAKPETPVTTKPSNPETTKPENHVSAKPVSPTSTAKPQNPTLAQSTTPTGTVKPSLTTVPSATRPVSSVQSTLSAVSSTPVTTNTTASKAMTRLPQTNESTNWLAVILGCSSLLLSFGLIYWYRRKI
ncbi:cell surface adherence protein,collagen-binding domain, LPXTG-motif cell wall anchor [Lactobacillus plantarum WCFS1] [Lactiplantibacillus mudanjiangensis]|uniref:LPXTG cell wall anchor domain-containing protein n=1 Tax=Lactiplantibacillus mudanjiangensis TaxID=1296538 RepID=UPI001013EBE5|nr:cell surface adherence protein,collagen-binding domain, LPXTG-motif cell wall anchor [Lactobacillus plantarum WCFS1] [Lactiplantibacillus mudanjiangensis]